MKQVPNLREIKALYKIICARDLVDDSFKSVNAVLYLETTTKQKFINTKDLKEKMDRFIFDQEQLAAEGAES